MFHLLLTWTNCEGTVELTMICHDDIIKWKYFPCYCPFLRGIYRSPEDSPHKGQWRRGLMFSLICVWTNGWANNRDAGDYDVTYCHGAHVIPYHVFRYYTAELRCYNDSLSRRCPDNVEPVLDHFTKFFFYVSGRDLSGCQQFQAGRTRWMRLRNSLISG